MLHFDLSQEEKYDSEYQRLVKRLYGIEIVEKPELGKKPLWLEEKSIIQTKTRTGYECLKQQKSDNIKKDEYRNFLFAVKEKIVNFRKDELGDSVSTDEYIELYADTKLYRDEFLSFIKIFTLCIRGTQNYSIRYGRNMCGNKK